MKRIFLAILTALATLNAAAQKVEVAIVTSGNSEAMLAITDIDGIEFGDNALTIHRRNDAALIFTTAQGWSLSFGETEANAITIANGASGAAALYTLSGAFILRADRAESLRTDNLPTGVYIMKTNGKSVKITK